jgi:succinate dehydrogenase hydrophobic anchor subunit
MKSKAIMWMIFSGTATACAFFLPGFIWTLIIQMKYSYYLNQDYSIQSLPISLILLLLLCALFHSLYRIPVLITDLGFSKTAVLVSKIICSAIFIGMIGIFVWTISRLSTMS